MPAEIFPSIVRDAGPSRPAPWVRLLRYLAGGGGRGSVVVSLVLLTVVIIAATASVIGSLRQVDALQARRDAIEHAHRVVIASTELLSLLKDAETGQRGYLLIHDDAYLAPYRDAMAGVDDRIAGLAALVADDAAQRELVARAQRQIGRIREILEATIAAQRERGPDAAVDLVRAGDGKAAMDELRVTLVAITTAEQQELARREALIPGMIAELRALLVFRAGLLILVIAAAWLLNVRLAQSRAQVARSRHILATTLVSIGDGVIVTDAAGRVLFLNAEAVRLTGWTNAEAAGRPLHEVFRIVNETSRLPVENPVEKVLRLGQVVGLANHTVLIGRDGRETPIDDSAAPIRDGDADSDLLGVILVFRDFSHHKQLERALLDQQRTLETRVAERTSELEAAHGRLRIADRMAAVGTLASGLAHDIKNLVLPLSIRLDSAVSSPDLPDRTREELAGIAGLLEHLREMARNLSLFAKDPEQEGSDGRTELAEWAGRVRGFIDASVLGDPRQPGRRITVEWAIPPRLPAVRVAPHRLSQAVLNLAHNARDAILTARYPAPGGPAPRPEAGRIVIAAEIRPGGATVAVSVTDDGCGMEPDIARRAVEPFFTTKNRSGDAGLAGSGLGLSLVSAIAERCGGRIDIRSRPGQGTTIALVLPVAEPPPGVGPEPSAHRIAFVDIEDKSRRAAVIDVLRELRYEITEDPPGVLWITEPGAATPEDASDFLRHGPGRKVVVLGGSADWREAGAIVVDAAEAKARLRDLIAQRD